MDDEFWEDMGLRLSLEAFQATMWATKFQKHYERYMIGSEVIEGRYVANYSGGGYNCYDYGERITSRGQRLKSIEGVAVPMHVAIAWLRGEQINI